MIFSFHSGNNSVKLTAITWLAEENLFPNVDNDDAVCLHQLISGGMRWLQVGYWEQIAV